MSSASPEAAEIESRAQFQLGPEMRDGVYAASFDRIAQHHPEMLCCSYRDRLGLLGGRCVPCGSGSGASCP